MDADIVGLVGELNVQRLLNINRDRFGIRHISNFPILLNGRFSQVDSLVVCNKGLLVLEVKNWQNCTIYCNNTKYWRVVYPTREIMVASPQSQNRGHCKKIYSITGIQPCSIILFADSARLLQPSEEIMHIGEFMRNIAGLPDIFAASQIDAVYEKLMQYKKSIEPQMLMDFIIKRVKL